MTNCHKNQLQFGNTNEIINLVNSTTETAKGGPDARGSVIQARPLRQIDAKWVRGAYLNFRDDGIVSKGSVTHRFSVMSRHNGSLLGYVKWYPQWRQYTFWPLNAVFDKKCLREIADFVERVTNEHREKRK